MSEIDPRRVQAIFQNCLLKEGEQVANPLSLQGLYGEILLHPLRLAGYREEIVQFLTKLPEELKTADDFALLDACSDKSEDKWAYSHERINELLLLAVALGAAKFTSFTVLEEEGPFLFAEKPSRAVLLLQ